MNRSLQRIALGFVPATITALVLWVPAAAPVGLQNANLAVPVGLQNVHLACSDGTNLALALDFDAVTQLADAVSAIHRYPAGDPPLTCSLRSTGLSTGPSFSAAASSSDFEAPETGNGPQDYVVGGGQYKTNCGVTNFSISAHAPDGVPAAAKGTWNVSIPETSPCGQGSFTAKVDCLAVSGNTGDTTGLITQASGFFGVFEGNELTVEGFDNSPDALTAGGGFFTSGPCDFFGASDVTTILHGNINVHDN